MSNVPARVAADAAQADKDLAALAAAAAAPQPQEPTPQEPEPQPQEPTPQEPKPAPTPTVQPTDLAAEMRRMQQLLMTTQGRLDAIVSENQRLRTQIEQRPAEPTPPPAPPPALLTEKDVEDYGADVIDLIKRAIDQQAGRQIEELSKRIAGLEGRLGQVAQQTRSVHEVTQKSARQKYVEQLNAQIPGWESVNDDPAFLDWLENVDTLSGKKYIELLTNAHQRADAGPVIHIFKLFKPELGRQDPAAPANPTNSSAKPATGHVDPTTLAAPDTSAPTPPPSAPPTGAVWSKADVDKLYDDKRKGRISNTEFEKREKEYFKALAEGRVSAQ